VTTQRSDPTSLLDQGFDIFPDLLFLVNSEGVILDYRGGRDAQLYARPDAFLGRSLHAVLPPPAATRLGEAVARVSHTQSSVTVDYTLPMPEGERAFEARLVPFVPDAVLAVCRDVSDTPRPHARLEAEHRVADTPLAEPPLDDWHLMLRTRPNVLIEGAKAATEAALRRLLWHSLDPGDALGSTCPSTLIVRDVASLSANEQPRLQRWIEDGEQTQILSTSHQPLFRLVVQGQFSADLVLPSQRATARRVILGRSSSGAGSTMGEPRGGRSDIAIFTTVSWLVRPGPLGSAVEPVFPRSPARGCRL
jgi:hypothetical protein